MTGNEDGGIKPVLSEFIDSKPKDTLSSYQFRRPFFNKYPSLYGVHSALFRVRHLQVVYDLDVREELFKCISSQKLDDLSSAIVKDNEAMRCLSTIAINFLYLYRAMLLGEKEFVVLQHFIDISRAYDQKDIEQLQLFIYFFTHCIIGETSFYLEEIRPQRTQDCIKMLKILERVIDGSFQDIKLDNKLEFLVCCRICGIDSQLFERVYDECQRSLSDEGHFLVDVHNNNAQKGRATFSKAEHRNVLYIMSHSPFNPHSEVVT